MTDDYLVLAARRLERARRAEAERDRYREALDLAYRQLENIHPTLDHKQHRHDRRWAVTARETLRTTLRPATNQEEAGGA